MPGFGSLTAGYAPKPFVFNQKIAIKKLKIFFWKKSVKELLTGSEAWELGKNPSDVESEPEKSKNEDHVEKSVPKRIFVELIFGCVLKLKPKNTLFNYLAFINRIMSHFKRHKFR